VCPGIHSSAMQLLGQKVTSMSDISRHCVITFDEMSLRKELRYDAAKDVVEGLVQIPHKEATPCNQALVFMVRGLAANWKQPLSYYFSENAASAQVLQTLLFQVLEAVTGINLKPIVVVCDQGSCNRALYKQMGIEVHRPYFMVSTCK
jgi:hypothetical protein